MPEPGKQGERLILLTGATGYIGGRMLLALESRGEKVRCLVRHPLYLEGRVGPRTEVMAGDLRDKGSIENALEGVHTACYFVHSMGSGRYFEKEDREAARNFGEIAKAAGVERIIYLGGADPGSEPVIPHAQPAGGGQHPQGVRSPDHRVQGFHHNRLRQPVL